MKLFINLLIFLAFLASSAFAQNDRFSTIDNIEMCNNERGVWREFGNNCVDSCEFQFKKSPICTSSIIYSCDCGPGSCWYQNRCTSFSEYKVAFNEMQSQIEDNLKKARKQRLEEAAKANENPMFGALFGGEQTRFDYVSEKGKSGSGARKVLVPKIAINPESLNDATIPKPTSFKAERESISEVIDKSKIKIPQQILEMEKKINDEAEKQNLTEDSPGEIPFPEAPRL